MTAGQNGRGDTVRDGNALGVDVQLKDWRNNGGQAERLNPDSRFGGIRLGAGNQDIGHACFDRSQEGVCFFGDVCFFPVLKMQCDAVRDCWSPMKPVLGIETSCDETAAAVLDANGHVLTDTVFTQVREHALFGGVVPEIAARAHLKYLPEIVRQTMAEAGVDYKDLGGIAATSGPGLIGGLIVGCQFGKGLAIAHDLTFLAINHLEAHALTARLPGLAEPMVRFPYLLMLVSGGHSQCVAVRGLGQYTRLGGTIDDAVGEAFDKVAKLLDLPWPGGPALELLAAGGKPDAYALPRPMLRRPGCEMSFSGLKTAVAQAMRQRQITDERQKADLAASFQQAVTEVLADRAANACMMMRERFGDVSALVVAGGVAANRAVQLALNGVADRLGVRLLAPPPRLCSDNAVMVAWAGVERLRAGLTNDIDFKPVPRWPLETLHGTTA